MHVCRIGTALAMQVSVDASRLGAWFVNTKSVATERVHRLPFLERKKKTSDIGLVIL